MVMIVDDDDEIRAARGDVLAERGYGVSAASDGQLALARLEQGQPPDAIFLDLWTPVMSGWELLKALFQSPAQYSPSRSSNGGTGKPDSRPQRGGGLDEAGMARAGAGRVRAAHRRMKRNQMKRNQVKRPRVNTARMTRSGNAG